MKFVLLPLLLLLSLYQSSSAQESHDLIVIRQRWHYDLRDPKLERDPVAETDDRMVQDRQIREIMKTNDKLREQGMPVRDVPAPDLKSETGRAEASAAYVYEVTLKNGGKKDISSVTWEYVFVSPGTGKEVGRRRFETKASIRAGKTKHFLENSAIPPTGTIDVSKTGARSNDKYVEKIVIVRLDYADGSKWTAPQQ